MPVILNAETHTYVNTETNEKYISATQFLSKYKPEFDKEEKARSVSKREGVDVNVILEIWAEKTRRANAYGTYIHSIMETYLKDKTYLEQDADLIDSFIECISDITDSKSKFYSELIIANDKYKVAGMSDLIIERGNFFYVVDYKTNEKFTFTSKFNNYFLEPIDYLQDSKFNTYSLQLSLYAYMHEINTGKKCAGMKILHLESNTEQSKRTWRSIYCNYLKPAIESLLIDKHSKDLDIPRELSILCL